MLCFIMSSLLLIKDGGFGELGCGRPDLSIRGAGLMILEVTPLFGQVLGGDFVGCGER